MLFPFSWWFPELETGGFLGAVGLREEEEGEAAAGGVPRGFGLARESLEGLEGCAGRVDWGEGENACGGLPGGKAAGVDDSEEVPLRIGAIAVWTLSVGVVCDETLGRCSLLAVDNCVVLHCALTISSVAFDFFMHSVGTL